jgi:hypothetical protein
MLREPTEFSLCDTSYNGCFPELNRVVNRCIFAVGNVFIRALDEESPVCLASRHSHWLRFCPMRNCSSTFLPPFAPRPLRRFFATMDALTPARRALRALIRGNELPSCPGQVSLVHIARPSMHSVAKHLTRPVIASALPTQLDRLPNLPVDGPCPPRSGLDFALNPQARRRVRPNRVRHPTDCMFASGCSPPRLTTTQLPSATGSGHLPEGDFHPSDRACSQAHGFPLSRE